MKHTKKSVLATLEHIEKKGAGFWSRQGNLIRINFRMADGNDPTGWTNARSVEDYFGPLVKKAARPDPQSGTITLVIDGTPVYGKVA